jgi:predicted nucleotidyltransferase
MLCKLADSDPCYHVNAMSSLAKAESPGHAHAKDIRARGGTRLAPFGSTARGEAGPSSDVDLLIEVGPRARFPLVDLAGLERFLSGLLLRSVEFAFPSRLRERPRI